MSLQQIIEIFETNNNRVSKLLGVQPNNIKNWIVQKDKIPKKRLKQLAEVFEVDEEFFLRDLTIQEKIYLEMKFMVRKHRLKNDQLQQLIKEGVSVD